MLVLVPPRHGVPVCLPVTCLVPMVVHVPVVVLVLVVVDVPPLLLVHVLVLPIVLGPVPVPVVMLMDFQGVGGALEGLRKIRRSL